ncbi:MAG: cyclic nucleotide-binding protein [Bacteroidetes bacterium]|nr:MAG: cyclic nucleotide-binding protein [Bacteroidota bacterium]
MFDLLFKHISKRVTLSSSELEFLTTVFIPKKIRKKQYLLQEGEICKWMTFVSKGCLRSYTLDAEGKEHIVQFAIEDWWIADMYSYLTGEPSEYIIDALEDSELLMLDIKGKETVLENIPAFEKFLRMLLESNHIASHRRLHTMMTKTAEEKYLNFIHSYPQIMQRVPQHMVASYLGISPETLSRVRKQILATK